MSEIVKHDFGKETRESARILARLLGMAERQEADIVANPAKYIYLARDRIVEYELFIQQLQEAILRPWMLTTTNLKPEDIPTMTRLDTVIVDRRDYEALQAIKALLNARKKLPE